MERLEMKIGIVSLILSIRDRPLHYLSEVTFSALSEFIGGYSVCRWMTPDQVKDPEEKAWKGFTDWLREETGATEELSWGQIVGRQSASGKESAFDVFYSFFDKYLQQAQAARSSVPNASTSSDREAE